jgi:hypothetical protein
MEGSDPEVEAEDPAPIDQDAVLRAACRRLDKAGEKIASVLKVLSAENEKRRKEEKDGSPASGDAHRWTILEAQLNLLLEETRDVEGRVRFATHYLRDLRREPTANQP